jgi:hypothetical protein
MSLIDDTESRFIELTNFWYDYVGVDHHKDRDCKFYINQVYEYGKAPFWRIEHYGYIKELDNNSQYDSHESAQLALYSWLLNEIKEVINFYEDYVGGDDIDYNWRGAKAVCNKYKHILNYEN